MILLVVLPVVTLVVGLVRPHPGWWYSGNMGVLAGLATLGLFQTPPGLTRVVLVGDLFVLEGLRVPLGVLVDPLSARMVWVVFVISFLVHLYSTRYMRGDPRVGTFLAYLTLFTFFMVVLLVSPNYVQLFMGWEGVGLTSYLLVNFWHTRPAANKSSLKALVVNRVGDLFFLYLLLGLIRTSPGGVDFQDLGGPGWGFLVVGAAAAKSAQLGLHTWLPDAMEGPTPVSALIHAATMVTAGVFLLFRAPHLTREVGPHLVGLGTLTALFAGSVACFQFDLKRVIAYSTCSQLGFMVTAYVVSPELSLYHLTNHAFFKCLLFLLAGLVIHALGDEQDLRRMGGLAGVMPVTYALFLVGSLGLVGFPFLSGFYSKDSILECLYSQGYWFGYFGCLGGAYLTAYYSSRVVWLVFYGPPRGAKPAHPGEGDPLSLGVVSLLGGFTLLHGYLTRDDLVGWGHPGGWSTPLVGAEFDTPGWVKLAPLGVSLVALGGALVTQGWNLPPGPAGFLAKRWGWDLLDSAGARRALVKGYHLYVDLERGLFEWVGPRGVRWALARGYDFVRNRGWFSWVWFSGVAGFFYLGVASGTLGGEVLPYVPFWVSAASDRGDPG